MTYTIAAIVEGHGEVAAVPLLLRRLNPAVNVARPIRIPKSKLVVASELQRVVQIARSNIRNRSRGMILLILDADDDCAKEWGPKLRGWMRESVPDVDCFVVLIVREFESWILGGRADFDVSQPDTVGRVEERLAEANGGRYQKTIDQPRFTSQIDIDLLARKSKSFGRLVKRMSEIPE